MSARAFTGGFLFLALALAGAGCGEPHEPEERIPVAVAALRAGDIEGALAEAGRGARETGEDPALRARFDLLRAELLLARGTADDIAEAELIVAETYGTASTDRTVLARWHLARGYSRVKRARYEEALPALREASKITMRESMADVAIEALFHEGYALHLLGRDQEAEDRWEGSLALARQAGDRFQSAAALLNLSLSCVRGRRFDEAITKLEEAGELAGKEGADLLRAAILGNLAMCWGRVGDLDRAVEAGREAVEASRRAGATMYVCRGLGMLGQIQESRGEVDDALHSLREAVGIARELAVPGDVALWSMELAQALVRAGQYREAPAWIDAARAAYLETGSSEGLAEADLAEAALAAALGDDERVIHLTEAVLAALSEEPSLRWRAQAQLARALLRGGKPDEARERFAAALESIREDRDRLFRLESRASFLTLSIEVYQDYVQLLIESGLDDEALRAIESSRAQALLDGNEAVPRDRIDTESLVRLARDDDVALVSYWISPRGSFAWTFTANGARRTHLPGTQGLEKLVTRHRSMIEESWRDPLEAGRRPGRQLHRLLVEPVMATVPPGSRVIIVPDGALHRLNLETLVASEPTPHYLLEDWTIAVSPSLALLLADAPSPPPGDRSILLVGDPVEGDPDYPRLPHAARELDAVAERLAGFRAEELREAEATAGAVLERIDQGHAWIHFAAHAEASGGNPLDSAVVLSPSPDGSKLYARDIVEHEINADLVTLSACRSAGSRAFSGEGLVGFSWAFMRAGSPRVIAGLWDVSDRSTVTLMEELYTRLAAGEDAADALRSAKLRLLRSESNFSKPYYWGPFQLYTRTAHP